MMRHAPNILRIGLHGLLAVWMAIVAVAPFWHTDHAAPQVRDDAPGHDHFAGAWLCDATPHTIEPGIDCVLCKAQRHLSQYWTRTPGAHATLQVAAAPAASVWFVPRTAEHNPLAPRAPPLS